MKLEKITVFNPPQTVLIGLIMELKISSGVCLIVEEGVFPHR